MINKKYHLSKTKKEKDVANLDIGKLSGYKVRPKVKEKDAIEVNNIVFVDSNFSEKIVRKKIDLKIEYLLRQLKLIQDDDADGGTIEKNLMVAEKLRVQLINKYVKYLGHTYYGLTLKKIELIIEELTFKLYMREFYREQVHFYDIGAEREGRKGR